MIQVRTLAAVAIALGACRPAPPPRTPEFDALAARVAALEARLAHPTGGGSAAGPELRELADRVDELETLARETRALQQDIQLLVARLAERAAAAAPPVAATPRGDLLDPARRYRIAIAGSPAFGTDAAAVTLVLGAQLPEKYTHALWPTLRALRAKYGDELRVVLEGFVVHPGARASTIAACAVARQGAAPLDQLEDALWTARELAQTDATKPWPDADDARAAAGGAGVDLARFDADLPGCAAAVDREQRALALAGQTAAPTLWINGRPFVGAQPADRLAAVIDDELAKAQADRAKGRAAKGYYDRLMKTVR